MKTLPTTQHQTESVQVIRHSQVCTKLQISSAKLFDMVARGQSPSHLRLSPVAELSAGLKLMWTVTSLLAKNPLRRGFYDSSCN